MARRLRGAALSAPSALAALALAAPLLGAAPADRAGVLVDYGFDEEMPTGPDTVRVFAHARGSVGLDSAFRYGGYRALELRDVAGDGDFPELVAYFPEVSSGSILLQLALLVATPDEEWNVGLAGPGGFGLGEDGLAFWLTGRDGWLFHTSDSIPKRLHPLAPFTWYVLTVDYDVDAGRYDLWLQREGVETPLVALRDQPNGASRAGSTVSMLSFIGDAGNDLSSAVYYVDDVLVARDRPAALEPMVAPGRRRFFVDRQSPGLDDFLRSCPAVASLDEVGLAGARLAGLEDEEIEQLARLLEGGSALDVAPAALAPVVAFRRGCAALERGRLEVAATAFAAGAGSRGDGSVGSVPALLFGRGQALVGLRRWAELDRVLVELAGLEHDPRYALLAAFALARTGDADAAVAWVEPRARAVLDGGAAGEVRALDDDELRAAEAHIALLRAGGRLEEARAYAEQLASRAAAGAALSSRFHERAGQIAFTQRDLAAARAAFERAMPGAENASRLLLALADVAWLEGDGEEERRLREGIFGTLRVEP